MASTVTSKDAVKQARREHAAGRLADAEKIYRQILETEPNHSEALYLLGTLAGQKGDVDSAIELIRRSIALNADEPEAHRNLGVLLAQRGRFDEALGCFSKAAQLRPDDPRTHHDLGKYLASRGDLQGAGAAYRRAVELKGDFATAYLDLGLVYRAMGRAEEAIAAFGKAARVKPDYLEAHANLATMLGGVDRFEEALAAHAKAVAINPNAAMVHEAMGGILLHQHGAAAAVEHFQRAVQADPNLLSGWKALGSALQSLGRFDEAAECFRRMLAIHPESAVARSHLVNISGKRSESEIEPLKNLLTRANLPAEQRLAAEFALGEALDRADRFDEAFAHFVEANRLARQQRAQIGEKYDPELTHFRVNGLIETFTKEFFEKRRGWGDDSELPVFIVGMPRSGSTLLQQIAGSHPQVYGAGELTDIRRLSKNLGSLSADAIKRAAGNYLHRLRELGGAALRVVNKMPINLHYLGLIVLMFPKARVIFSKRDARDTCLSCYFQSFGDGNTFSFDLADCGHYYRENDWLMKHWMEVLPLAKIEIQYEEVVADLEGQSRRLIDFLGLQWDPACLQFQRAKSSVMTSSVWQVRQPIYNVSVGRWRHYEKYLGVLLAALAAGGC
jgi:tetratricopeptide (TPR) repeat protein